MPCKRLVRLKDEQDKSTRKCVIPVADHSNSYFCNAFGAVEEAFLNLRVLGLHVNLIKAQNRFLRHLLCK